MWINSIRSTNCRHYLIHSRTTKRQKNKLPTSKITQARQKDFLMADYDIRLFTQSLRSLHTPYIDRRIKNMLRYQSIFFWSSECFRSLHNLLLYSSSNLTRLLCWWRWNNYCYILLKVAQSQPLYKTEEHNGARTYDR